MRVAVLTSVPQGLSGNCLEAIASAKGVELAAVILAEEIRIRTPIRRKLRKTARIGLLGALNGLRLRRWFGGPESRDTAGEAERLGIPILRVPWINSPETKAALEQLDVDLAISLGNPYIAPSVFTIPKLGTINYHGELLPEYPGAQSIIWAIHHGRTKTGFTIHKVDKGIDTGAIVLRREFDIVFRPSLKETIRATAALIHPEIPATLAHVLENWSGLSRVARPQPAHPSYTTPTFAQFIRMNRNNRKLFRSR